MPNLTKLKVISLMSLWSIAGWAGPLKVQNIIKDNGQNATILTSTFQQTLYVFDPDQNTGKSVCNAKCAEVWPPVTMTEAEFSEMKNPDVTLVKRESGLNQLSYNGRPIYTFHLDRHSGDIKGDGIGGVWHIIEVK